MNQGHLQQHLRHQHCHEFPQLLCWEMQETLNNTFDALLALFNTHKSVCVVDHQRQNCDNTVLRRRSVAKVERTNARKVARLNN